VYIRGITLPKKAVKDEKSEKFAFRVKIGEYEVEIHGTHEEVEKTLQDLPKIVANVHKAFENVKPKTVATLTVKTEPTEKTKETPKTPAQTYPKITGVVNCEDAVFGLLETDWGKWRPRTMEELSDAMKANKITYTQRTLDRTLNKLAGKGMVRRWNTNAGFVYILAEKKPSKAGGKA
jgi:predicted transcriptional regulator